MTDMIERVARAMAESTNGGDFHDGRWYTEDHRKLWRQRARAAIEAMREPTDEMKQEGSIRDHCHAWVIYQAMIDTALGRVPPYSG